MSVLDSLFNKKINQCSPVQDDYVRVVSYDEDGNEYLTFEKFDYPKHQKSLGRVSDWSLDSLLKAGINPDFPIHTGMPTRLDGFSQLREMESIADGILKENNKD